MSLRKAYVLMVFTALLFFAGNLNGQFIKPKKSKSLPVFNKTTGFYKSPTILYRTTEQNIHTSMVNMGQQLEMDVISETLLSQEILNPKGDSQTLIVHPYKTTGAMIINGGDKRDLSTSDSSIVLNYHVNSMGNLKSISGNADYIDASRKSGLNNTQIGLNLMVYFRTEKPLYLGDSFQISHNGKPYTFHKTYILKEVIDGVAQFETHQQMSLHHNYDMEGYEMEQKVTGVSKGMMKVRLSDNLVTYNEENLELEGFMEMVSVNIPLTIKGQFKEIIQNL
jgi:hypothetical protein